MECSRCGGEAVVKRDNAVFCGKCALARDWEEVIHLVQADRLSMNTRPTSKGPASKPGAISVDGGPLEVKAKTAAAAPADPFA